MIRVVVEADSAQEVTEILEEVERVRLRVQFRDYAASRRHLHAVPDRTEAR